MPTPSAAADGVGIARDLGDAREGRGNVRGERGDAQGCALMMWCKGLSESRRLSETVGGSRRRCSH